MSEPTLQAEVEGARAYERLMVPALFGHWPSNVADAAEIRAGQRVLDVACGTGVLAREVASRTGPTGFVAGLDPGRGMLEVARQLAPAVHWQHGVAESLPFEDASFDRVVSQFGLMFFDDRRQALQEILRVLVSSGRMAVAVWDALDNIPAYQAEVALLDRVAGRAAGDAVRAPFALGDPGDLATLFADAEVSSVEVTTAHGKAEFPSVRAMIEADLRGWLPLMGVVLTEEQIAAILGEAEHVLRSYVTSAGTVAFDASAHIAIGVKS